MSPPAETLPENYFSEITRLLDNLDARPRPTHSPRGLAHRGTLGDFTSIVCFQEAVRGLEDVLGPDGTAVVLIRAGRLRGQALVDDWGVGHLDLPPSRRSGCCWTPPWDAMARACVPCGASRKTRRRSG